MRGFGVLVLTMLGLSAYLLTFAGCANEVNPPGAMAPSDVCPADCKPCQPAQPSGVTMPPTSSTSHSSEWQPRTGMMVCAGCNHGIVGNQVHTLWVDEGEAVSLLCRRCSRELPIARQRSIYMNWVQCQPSYDQRRLADQIMRQIGAPGHGAGAGTVPFVFTKME